MRSGEEIRQALVAFAARWADYQGTERSEAQTFLNELFACYGSDRAGVGAEFEKSKTSVGFMDLYWHDRVIIEMKAPREADRLAEHRPQAMGYWRHSSDVSTERPAPPYLVLCAFASFEIWEPGRFPDGPRATFTLDELPDRYETLLFLTNAGDDPLFIQASRQLTTEAAIALAHVYHGLIKREAARPEAIQRFMLQLVWLFFAEDFGMIDGRPTERMLKFLAEQEHWTSTLMFGGLFAALNDPSGELRHGALAGTHYVNGELFTRPALVHLTQAEAAALREIARHDWRQVDPTIFGSMMEGFLSGEVRSALGAHYTHEVDIMKIVRPVIVRPWRERIAAVATPAEARALLDELCRFRVLDPACGCGNFLYVAYRELRSLEHSLKARIRELAAAAGLPADPAPLPCYPLRNLHGLEIEPVAALITQVTLWMGHRQMIDVYGIADEPPLPLVNLSSIQQVDALRTDWPEVDCIIGNPPFLGSQHLRQRFGNEYLTWLEDTFHVGLKDFCVYWFRKAHDHLKPGQRAGLVGTNSISQNRARSASLDYLTGTDGVIVDAVSSQVWPGTAKVHVSLASWVKSPTPLPTEFWLDGQAVSGITAELRTPEASTAGAVPLAGNKGFCFQGVIPVGDGFILTEEEAHTLLARTDAPYRDVVRPYLTGEDIADDPAQGPRRWIIDFAQRTLQQAKSYPAAFKIVEKRVKPVRQGNNRKLYRDHWWQLGEARPGMRFAIGDMPRYIAACRVGKRLLLAWQDAWTCPSDKAQVFAFDDDYMMGVLASTTHIAWAWARSSTLKADLNYTPTSVFMTFPWPYPLETPRWKRISEINQRLVAYRQKICAAEGFGLTELYNTMDDGGYTNLKKLHRELDVAVAAAYGWTPSVAQDKTEIAHRLLALNREIADGRQKYEPFAARHAVQRFRQLTMPDMLIDG